MTDLVVVDNDVIFKLCGFGLSSQLLSLFDEVAMLNVARFALRSAAKRSTRIKDRQALASALEQFFTQVNIISPTDAEIKFAADLEEAAARSGLDLDTGESQLIAILLQRSLSLFLTGDKRAARAIHCLEIKNIPEGCILCLEQIMIAIIGQLGVEDTRLAVCAEPQVDRTLSICFACASRRVGEEDVRECLESHVGHLRRSTGAALSTN